MGVVNGEATGPDPAPDPGEIHFVHEALRTVAHRAGQQHKPMPPLRAVRLMTTSLDLILDEPAQMKCPAIGSAPGIWTVRGGAQLLGPPPGTPPPYPALAAAGRNADGELILLDLQTATFTGIIANGTCPMHSLRALTLELVQRPWATDVSLHVVGYGQKLADAFGDRVRYTEDAADLLDELEAAPTPPMLTPDPASQVDLPPADRPPEIILCTGLTHDEYTRLLRLAEARPDLSIAAALPKNERPPRHSIGWFIDAHTGRIQFPTASLQLNLHGVGRRAFRHTIDELALQHEHVAAPGVEELGIRQSRAQPPEVPEATPVNGLQVRVLGDVQILGAVGELKDPTKQARLTELVAYIACHPGTTADAITDAFWPGRPSRASRSTLNTAISRARSWLGTDPKGDPYLAEYSINTGYRLSESAFIDWSRFNQYVGSTVGADQYSTIAELTQALALVRDAPFHNTDDRHYTWADLTLVPAITTTITAQAHRLAQLYLDIGEPARARGAVSKGLLVDRLEPHLWCDLLQTAAGNPSSLHSLTERYLRQCRNLDVRPDKEVVDLSKAVLGRASSAQ